jgi:replicative DNA helicase
MESPRRIGRESLANLMQHMDATGDPDTIPTGFGSVDRVLGGGIRKRDCTVLGGDVGSGKSALALAMALRIAARGEPVVFVSGEMDEERLFERALAIEGKKTVDQLRQGGLAEADRSAVGAAAVRLRDLPLVVYPIVGRTYDEVLDPVWAHNPAVVVVDYLQLMPPPNRTQAVAEEAAHALRALKATALAKRVAIVALAQLPNIDPTRPDPRPVLDDYGALGAVKQHADVVLSLFREEMYVPDPTPVAGAAELIISKNRNGETGFVDLYFHRRWMRFEDMLDPE